jgi:flagellar hook-length control protein FliK
MALKNVSTAATASAKSAATSSANAASANAGAPDSALAVIAANFLSVLTGFGAQGTPTPPAGPAKSKDDAAPAAAAPPVPTGGAGALSTALLAAAQSPTAPVTTPAPQPSPAASITAIPIGSTPGAPTPSVMPLANMAADLPPVANATSAVPPPTITPPTVMPAVAAPVTQAASGNVPAAANKSSAPSSAAKPGNPPSAAPSNDVAPDGGDIGPTTAATAPASSDAWLLPPGIRLPTLQPAVTPSLAASTAMSAEATSDSEEGDPASDSTDTSETSPASPGPAVKSVTDPVAFALSADAATSITQSNSSASTSADSMPSAAAAAAQAAPMHNAAHMQSTTDTQGPTELRSPVGSAAWTEELGTQLTWMSRHGQDSASLRLSPDHLGPVEVRIEVRDGATSVWFGAAHADTRSALEQSLPRLRELFAASGLLLADAGVARDAPRQNTRPGAPISLGGTSNEPTITSSKVSPASSHSGLVDTYV